MRDKHESFEILERALDAANADEADAIFMSSDANITRFANSNIHQNMSEISADLTLRSGEAVLTCHLDYLARPPLRGGHLVAERGSARWNLLTPSLETWTDHEASWRTTNPPEGWTPNDMYLDEVRHFIRCLEGRESPLVDGEEALRSIRLVEAAKRSARERLGVRL